MTLDAVAVPWPSPSRMHRSSAASAVARWLSAASPLQDAAMMFVLGIQVPLSRDDGVPHLLVGLDRLLDVVVPADAEFQGRDGAVVVASDPGAGMLHQLRAVERLVVGVDPGVVHGHHHSRAGRGRGGPGGARLVLR